MGESASTTTIHVSPVNVVVAGVLCNHGNVLKCEAHGLAIDWESGYTYFGGLNAFKYLSYK